MAGERTVDEEFSALPLQQLADAALQTARDGGASYAAFRMERILGTSIRLRDAEVEGVNDTEDIGYSVRVILDGTWGFASDVERTPEAAVRTARRALDLAKVSAPVNTEPVDLSPEAAHHGTWISSYDVDPWSVPNDEKITLLQGWSRQLLDAEGVNHVDTSLLAVKENKFYADLAGTVTTQQRVRLHPELEAVAIDARTGAFETMGTIAPPVGHGWEYLTGSLYDWRSELAQLPGWLNEKLAAPSIEPGRYDLVIDPSNLWLTIHESIGHATELDRALGYEANYAGMSFATPDKLGTLKYGSDLMHITGDRTVEHGLSSVGWDDEGVEAQQFDIVKDGVLVGYQLDRRIASRVGYERSNGCAFADSPGHVPIQRMANVSLQPAQGGPSTADQIAALEDGIYVVGDKSWSIDMQRYNFQFTGQRFFRIRSGRLAGQVKDVAYQATTTDFWGSMASVGGPSTYVLGGAFNCGKAQPGQVAPVSHGAPSATFTAVNILNTAAEGGR
ncbi:MAG TPA: TldD/PmbA family protein [Actinomycetes bacterium]|nr:TldD/PmbA family protein [Actinomycetes bacterium]